MQHPTEEDLVLYHYGEHLETAELEDHLRGCGACRAEYDAMVAALSALGADTAPDPGPDYGREVWRRLEPRLVRRTPVRWWAAAGAIAAMILVALLAGRITPRRQPQAPVDWAQASRRILLADVSEHLERAELVLTEAAHAADPAVWPPDLTQDLIEANRLYRQAAAGAGEPAVAAVLEDVERALIEISHHSPTPQGLELDDIVFKVRATASQVRARELEVDRVKGRS
jgi:predicted anti-sigma-YlaC factor YlaD